MMRCRRDVPYTMYVEARENETLIADYEKAANDDRRRIAEEHR
jgi:hypothetical protein